MPKPPIMSPRRRRRQGPEAGLGQFLNLRVGVTERADEQVLQCLDVFGVDDLRVHRHTSDLPGAAHGDGHEPASGLTGDCAVCDLLLRLGELGLHLLGLLEEGVHVGSGLHGGSFRLRAVCWPGAAPVGRVPA